MLLLTWLLISSSVVVAAEGLVKEASAHEVATTVDRLEAVLLKKGMTVFARIDHSAGAKKVGRSLPATEVLVFGNPKIGSVLMACSRTIGIDLPQKAPVWADADGKTWLAYNEPKHLAAQHQAGGYGGINAKVTQALANFAKAATAP